jgi:hypothetical protein
MSHGLSSEARINRRTRPHTSPLHCLSDFSLESAAILRRIGELRQRLRPTEHPQGRGNDSDPHPRIAALEANQRRDGHTDSPGPRSLGLAPADTGDREVFSKLLQCLDSRRRKHG